jgi:hypothetical protein
MTASMTSTTAAPAATGIAARRLDLLARLVAAGILGQTLFFKFSGAAESRWIFESLGAEPWGRLGTGVMEAVAVGLLLLPRTAALGALLAVGLMAGAVGSHLAVLGIEVQGDGGLLFTLACLTAACTGGVALRRRSELLALAAPLLTRR